MLGVDNALWMHIQLVQGSKACFFGGGLRYATHGEPKLGDQSQRAWGMVGKLVPVRVAFVWLFESDVLALYRSNGAVRHPYTTLVPCVTHRMGSQNIHEELCGAVQPHGVNWPAHIKG